MAMVSQAPLTQMLRKPATVRDRGGRRTVTVDLLPEHFDSLASIAQDQDLRPSTMARLLLLSALARREATDAS